MSTARKTATQVGSKSTLIDQPSPLCKASVDLLVSITDDSGGILSEQRYLPFGQVREDVGTIAQTDFGYTGQRAFGDMGLMDYKARFYDALNGRFSQPDSIVPNPLNPQALNRYSYVYNNPVNHIDTDGHCIDVDEGLCLRVAKDKTNRVVHGGNIFANDLEVALANYLFSNDPSTLLGTPTNISPRLVQRTVDYVASQFGYGNFNPAYDMALDPTVPLILAGLVANWKWFQSPKAYVQGLEGSNPDAHAWSKHGATTGADLAIEQAALRNPGSTQTRFTSNKEMAKSISSTLEVNQTEILANANSGKAGNLDYWGPSAGYSGYKVVNGNLTQISGKGPVKVVVWYDGNGNWGLLTAFPVANP